MDFFQIYQNPTIYTDVTVIRPPKLQNKPFVSHLLAGDPESLIPNVVAILPDIDGFFLQISSKLDYLWSISSHLTFPMIVLTLCLSHARWRMGALVSQCSSNIAKFRWISSNFIKTQISIRM